MGMSDQYDDGRYDGERYNPKTDQWLPGGDPRLPKYRGVELPGGWCVPPDQAPELRNQNRISPELIFVRAHPIRVQRGGIKYPTPTKETHMPERLTKAQITQELKLNDGLLRQLRERRQDLQRQAQTALPAEPNSSFTMFSVSVRFKMRGQRYQFLILRHGGVYWTTGTDASQQKFESWDALCSWLEGPDVYDHTDIEILKGAGRVVSFDTGQIQVDEGRAGEPPF